MICAPALRAILENNYPNYAADLKAADQLAYHLGRLERYFRIEPYGQTVIKYAKNSASTHSQLRPIRVTLREERVAFINSLIKNGLIAQVNVYSLIDGQLLCVRADTPVDLENITLSSCLVTTCTIIT